MNLLSIPEMIEGNILPYLKWNDLLRFRRVCKVTKAITQGYIKCHPELTPEIEIREDDKNKSFAAFLNMNIPTNKIFLNNFSGQEFYQKDGKSISKFLKKCGPLVKHLRVKQFSLYLHGNELGFLEALVNLESFESEYFEQGTIDPRFVANLVPVIFNQLKSLKIGLQRGITNINIVNRSEEILRGICARLEHVSLPLLFNYEPISLPTDSQYFEPNSSMIIPFSCIDFFLRGTWNLKTFDFCSFHNEQSIEAMEMQQNASKIFLDLLVNCIKYGVKLKNVGSLWFTMWRAWFDLPELCSPDLGIPVLSLVNLSPFILPLNMPNLERVEIRTTFDSLGPGPEWRRQRPDWPALKSVDITVKRKPVIFNVRNDGKANEKTFETTKMTLQFFFQDIQRTNLSDIRLNFIPEAGKGIVPKTLDIVASCPNLRKITLNNWPGTNKALINLWDGLAALEEISLEYCKELGNVAFVGEDAKNPVFIKLKKLRKLSMIGLDKMPKITDTLFSLVLRHMNLTHLILTSTCPVKSVTRAGILSLLEGNFAEKIEKFPFQNWSLEGVSMEEFRKMEAKFRSYNMI